MGSGRNEPVRIGNRYDELNRRAEATDFDVGALSGRIDRADERARFADARARAAEARAEVAEQRATRDRRRIRDIEGRLEVDRELIEALQAEGLVERQQAEDLREALSTSRQIGAAIGIVMVQLKVDEATAFKALSVASQHANRKLHEVASDVLCTGDVSVFERH